MKLIDQLLLILLRVCALESGQVLSKSDLDILNNNKNNLILWNEIVFLSQLNKVDNLLYYSLKKQNLTNLVPDRILVVLFTKYSTVCIKNRQRINKLNQIIRALNQENIIPAVWKGIVLIKEYYEEIGMRNMDDIDLYIALENKTKTMKILSDMGFIENVNLEQSEECFNGIDENGIQIDVHFSARFFEKFSSDEIYESKNESGFTYLSFEKNAFLALLVEHELGHALIQGIKIKYFFDLLVFYKKDLASLDYSKLSKYFTKKHWKLLAKSNLFLASIVERPMVFEVEACPISAFDIRQIRTLNLFTLWALNIRIKAWFRLILTWLGLIEKKHMLCPNPIEILYGTYNILKLKLI